MSSQARRAPLHVPQAGDLLPGVDLAPLNEPHTGQPGPYARSGLRSVVGSQVNPRAREGWYVHNAPELVKGDAPVITVYHPYLDRWIETLDGLDADWTLSQSPAQHWPLSRVIPRVVPGPRFPEWKLPVGTYWVDYVLLTASTRHLPTSEWIPQLKERLPEGSKLILGAIGPYATRAALWAFRHQLWEHPMMEAFDYVVVPDISSYLNDPAPHALIGERMTQLWAEVGAERGFEIIPIVSWQSEDALLRQVDRLGSLMPDVNTVYIELLARKPRNAPKAWKDWWLHSRFDDIEKHLAHLPLRFLLSGVDAGWAVNRMSQIIDPDRAHLITVWPWMRAAMEPGLSEQKARKFRASCARVEGWLRGEELPAVKPRPESVDLAAEAAELDTGDADEL